MNPDTNRVYLSVTFVVLVVLAMLVILTLHTTAFKFQNVGNIMRSKSLPRKHKLLSFSGCGSIEHFNQNHLGCLLKIHIPEPHLQINLHFRQTFQGEYDN